MSAAENAVRILIVEDVATDAELAARELKRAGLRVAHRIADTEAAFRAALAEFTPHLILSDFTMPHFDGMHALALARELTPDTPFIFVSGTLGEEYAIRALKNGATDYVLKTNLIRLPAAVERALAEAQARAERRRTEAALAEARARLTSIMETLPDVLWSSTLDGEKLLYVSPAARAVLGREPAELESNPRLWFEVIHPKDKPRVRIALQGAAGGESFEIEYRILRPDGGVRWLGLRGRLARDAAGAPLRIDGIARDLTEEVAQRERLARLARVRELGSAVNAAIVRVRGRGELLEDFCRIAVQKGGLQGARVVERVADGGPLRIALATEAASDTLAEVVEAYNRDPDAAQGLLAEAMRSGRSVVSNDVSADPRVVAHRKRFARDGVRALACLPLVVDRKVAGTVVLRAHERNFFDEEELRLLEELTANLAFALELMDKRARVEFLAYYDPLTGLPNRALFKHRLTQAIDATRAGGGQLALVTLDVERFKAINEAFGSAAGDELLQRIAELAAEAAGDRARVARFGANQFALLVPALRNPGDLGRRLERMTPALLDTLLEVRGRELRIAAKAGAAIYPDDGGDAETLISNAEAAMRRAKTTGERYHFYAPALNARVAERLDLEARLRRAVERGEFALLFQPKVELAGNRIVGLEALLRWRGGDGSASPGEFVPVLEDTGLIVEVGAWAMREAVATHGAWRARALPAPRIAVNVSAIQLRGRAFVDTVRAALGAASGADCGLDLEITESLLMENIEDSLAKLREVRDLGVRIALDDFGTGYSSLGYLSKLPIDALKIDRTFVQGMTEHSDDTTIVSAMISLGRTLELEVIAEGVETEAQAQLLRLLRCDQMQGYLYSRPLSGDEIARLLAARGGGTAPVDG